MGATISVATFPLFSCNLPFDGKDNSYPKVNYFNNGSEFEENKTLYWRNCNLSGRLVVL